MAERPSHRSLRTGSYRANPRHKLPALVPRERILSGICIAVKESILRLDSLVPAKIDRIGRSHEWLTSAAINEAVGNPNAAARDRASAAVYTATLDPADVRRVETGAEHSSRWILRVNQKVPIRESVVIGERSKAPGGPDFDLELTRTSGGPKGYSLKLQHGTTGVNLRNPTLNSFLRGVSGRTFQDVLSPDEWEQYKRKGEAYSQGQIESKEIGRWAAPVVAEALRADHKARPTEFVRNLLKEMRVGTNLLITSVDSDANFLGYVSRFGEQVTTLRSNPEILLIQPKGISVCFSAGASSLCHLDLYMLSYSRGEKGNRLRGAIRADFELDPS